MEKTLNSDKFLCFVHIEKCAGSSLHTLLQNNFGNYIPLHPQYKIGDNFSLDQLNRMRRVLPRIDGVGGHRCRSFLDYDSAFPKRGVFYLTFLRDPIKRYLSHLNYQIQVMDVSWKIEEFLEDEHYHNFQAFRLCGHRDAGLAWNELQRFNFVGLTELYDESIFYLRFLLGMEMNLHYETINDGRARKGGYRYADLAPSIRKKIIDNNAVDLEIYRKAREVIFQEYKNRFYSKDLEREIISFKKENKSFRYKKFRLATKSKKSAILQRIPWTIETLFS